MDSNKGIKRQHPESGFQPDGTSRLSHASFVGVVLSVVICGAVLLGVSPRADRMTWALENFPVWFGIAILAFTYRRFPLSRLCLTLFTLHTFILMVGGYYTYAKVPLGEWWKHWFGWERNHYDRLGHFAQGFVPALLVRELLLRTTSLRGSRWIPFLSVCVALAFSAFYEFIEWWSALLTGEAARDFLGTQGDIWDTQWDMFLALIGALCAVIFMTGLHDRSMTRTPIWNGEGRRRPGDAIDPAKWK